MKIAEYKNRLNAIDGKEEKKSERFGEKEERKINNSESDSFFCV